jgi:hypothetical protein
VCPPPSRGLCWSFKDRIRDSRFLLCPDSDKPLAGGHLELSSIQVLIALSFFSSPSPRRKPTVFRGFIRRTGQDGQAAKLSFILRTQLVAASHSKGSRVKMAVKAVIPFLVAMMLLTGVCNTLLTKYQVRCPRLQAMFYQHGNHKCIHDRTR